MTYSIDKFKGLVSSKGGIARTNIFRVTLPALPGASTREIDLLCKNVNLPGRQIMTNERMIGTKVERIPYGHTRSDVSMTFHVLNDYGIRNYFETWQNRAVNQNTFEVGYQKGADGYAFDIKIEQLKHGVGFPVYSTPLGIPKLPTILQNRLPKVGPFDLAQGELDLNFITKENVVYSCKLIAAFPTSMSDIQLSNDQDGLVELNVTLSYTNWISETPGVQSSGANIGLTLGTLAANILN